MSACILGTLRCAAGFRKREGEDAALLKRGPFRKQGRHVGYVHAGAMR